MRNRDINTDAHLRDVANALFGLIENAMDEATQLDDAVSYDIDPQEVCAQPYDGFIPHTNGGWHGTVLADIAYARGSGHIPARLKDVIEREETDAAARWVEDCAEDYGYDPEEHEHMDAWGFIDHLRQIEEDKGPTFPELYLKRDGMTALEQAEESLYDYIDTYLNEGGTYFYKVKALFFDKNNLRNESGEDEVLFLTAINTDFEYGRDTYDEILYSRNVRLADLMDTEGEIWSDIQNEMAESWSKA